MSRTRILLRKELLEIWRSRGLIASMFALPVPAVAVAIGLVITSLKMPIEDVRHLVDFYKVAVDGDVRQSMLIWWVHECLGLFMLMPLFIPVMIAAPSVAGEKERRTIEPLLASPLTAKEIVVAKSLASVLPALAVTVISFTVFAVAVDALAYPVARRLLVPDATWIYALCVLSPLLSFLGNTVTVLISSRVNDSRLAQQLSGMITVPLLGFIAVQFLGVLQIGPRIFYVGLAVVVFVADVVLLALAVRFFDRQRILSRIG